ncbi:General amino acid permease [Savitreella phatthalungensis]
MGVSQDHNAYDKHHDASDGTALGAVPPERNAGVSRVLKSRHIQMIAIGGIIGPGLLVGSGGALAAGGPAAVIIVFALVGFLSFLVMQSVGELSTLYPQGGSFTTWSARFADDAFSLVVGWNYWLIWVSVLANEVNVTSQILRYWTTAVPVWAWILILTFIFTAFATVGVGAYGEAEFWLATIKLIGLLAFFIGAILIDTGAVGDKGYLGFRYYRDPGAFKDGFAGVASVFSYVATYYAGVEAIGVTAGETQNAVKAIPIAIKQVFIRIIVIYMGTIFFYTLTVPYTAPNLISASSKAAASPMSIALVNAGWNAAPNLINAFILVAVISAMNSCIYISSRCLTFMATEGKAPRVFRYTTKRGVPLPSVIFCGLFGLVALVNTNKGAGRTYSALVNISSVSTFIVWGAINFIHLRHMAGWRAQGRDRSELPYRSWWQPWQAALGLFLNIVFTLIQGYSSFAPFDAANFVIAYILLPVSALGYVLWKLIHRTRIVHPLQMDLDSDRLDLYGESDGIHTRLSADSNSLVDSSKNRSLGRRIWDQITGDA